MPRLTCLCLFSLAPVMRWAGRDLAALITGKLVFRSRDQKVCTQAPAR